MNTYQIRCKALSTIATQLVIHLPSTKQWQAYPDDIRDVTNPCDFPLLFACEKYLMDLSDKICVWALNHDYYLH